MTEHKHPEHFPEHLRPYLLPIPETREEALLLLLEWHRAEIRIRQRAANLSKPCWVSRPHHSGNT